MMTEKDMPKPVYVYYQLTRFYQNHRRYVTSRNDEQLQGKAITAKEAKSKCEPRAVCGDECPPAQIGKIYNPCGLVAWSVFNDSYAVAHKKAGIGYQSVDMDESGIAWKSDLDKKFKAADCPKTDYCWLHERSMTFNTTKMSTTKTNVENEHFVVRCPLSSFYHSLFIFSFVWIAFRSGCGMPLCPLSGNCTV
jgi:hypothetical protein